MDQQVRIRNKKASFKYELLDKMEAGIELYGTEIKSIRNGQASLSDSYCFFRNHELFVLMHIAEYEFGTINNHEPKRERKLLLKRRELDKLEKKVQATGLTIVPTVLYINDKGYAKLQIAVAKGKKTFDKRHTIKEKDQKRDLDRLKKN